MAVFMWGIVSVAVGFTLASWWRWEGKQMGFVILVVVGIYVLILIWWQSRSKGVEIVDGLSEKKKR